MILSGAVRVARSNFPSVKTVLLTSSRPLTDEDLVRYTGQTAIRDVSTAEGLVTKADDAVLEARLGVRRHWLSLAPCLLRYCATILTTGFDHADAVLVGAVSSLAATVLVIAIVRPTLPAALTFWIIGSALLYLVFFFALRTRPGELGKDRVATRRERWRSFFQEARELAARRAALVEELAYRQKLLAQLQRAESRAEEIAELLATELRLLSGVQFEQFLERAFTVLGYQEVQRTQASGDQGIDLIVGDGRERVAVQVKLYQGSVGNEAVQQAYAGMAHYRCHRCAVVTSSTFTRSAVQLAASTGCKLIDGQGLRALLTGTVRL